MIKIHAHILKSKLDINGNSYYSAIVTNNETSATAYGQIDSESNLTIMLSKFYPGEYQYNITELPIRQYNKAVKTYPYIGCLPNEMHDNILKQWKESK
jgi:hypothetical protein